MNQSQINKDKFKIGQIVKLTKTIVDTGYAKIVGIDLAGPNRMQPGFKQYPKAPFCWCVEYNPETKQEKSETFLMSFEELKRNATTNEN